MVTEGKDVTLVAYGPLVKTAKDAALAAADEGVSIEVIDLRSLAPLDFATAGGLGPQDRPAGHHP